MCLVYRREFVINDLDEWLTLGISCIFKEIIEDGTTDGFQKIKPEFEKMVDNTGQKLADHIMPLIGRSSDKKWGKGPVKKC